jgi:hypothetical protein
MPPKRIETLRTSSSDVDASGPIALQMSPTRALRGSMSAWRFCSVAYSL